MFTLCQAGTMVGQWKVIRAGKNGKAKECSLPRVVSENAYPERRDEGTTEGQAKKRSCPISWSSFLKEMIKECLSYPGNQVNHAVGITKLVVVP